LKIEDNRKMTRLPNGRWVFEDCLVSTEFPGSSAPATEISKEEIEPSPEMKSNVMTDLERKRFRKCEALLCARDIHRGEWRRVNQDRYEASVGKRSFYVEFWHKDITVNRFGWVGDFSEIRTDEWMLQNSVPIKAPKMGKELVDASMEDEA